MDLTALNSGTAQNVLSVRLSLQSRPLPSGAFGTFPHQSDAGVSIGRAFLSSLEKRVPPFSIQSETRLLVEPDIFEATHVGKVRAENEDSVLAIRLGAGRYLFAVADGVGGSISGGVASRLALETFREFGKVHLDSTSQDAGDVLHAAVLRSQAAIEEHVARNIDQAGMGTTLTAAYLCWPEAHVVHVGDSRCYRLSGQTLTCLTMDHTVAELVRQMGVRRGESLQAEEHLLWNVVGGRSPDIMPQVTRQTLQRGDTLLLCTDGLTRELTGPEIVCQLKQCRSSKEACERLVAAANAAGGKDNITVVVGQFGNSGLTTGRHAALPAASLAQGSNSQLLAH